MPEPQAFPGCWRFEELARDGKRVALLDRTPLYGELARLEAEFLGSLRGRTPKVDLTLAEMLVTGSPT
jgi:hypothetical protein